MQGDQNVSVRLITLLQSSDAERFLITLYIYYRFIYLLTYILSQLHTYYYLLTYLLTYLHTYLLTYLLHTANSFLRTNHFSASQEIPHILWNLNVHYRIRMCPPPVRILSQIDPVHTRKFHFLKIHFNIILPCMPGSPKWSLSLRSPHQNPVHASLLPHTRYMPRPSNSSRFYHPNSIG